LRASRAGGIDRAGVTSTGRGGATCRIGIGEGSGFPRKRRRGRTCATTLAGEMCVLRAGVAARARLTVAFECLADTLLRFLRLERRVFRVLRREADGRLPLVCPDRLAALTGRFVFTPPPCRP
jgi:hypothetical protein